MLSPAEVANVAAAGALTQLRADLADDREPAGAATGAGARW